MYRLRTLIHCRAFVYIASLDGEPEKEIVVGSSDTSSLKQNNLHHVDADSDLSSRPQT